MGVFTSIRRFAVLLWGALLLQLSKFDRLLQGEKLSGQPSVFHRPVGKITVNGVIHDLYGTSITLEKGVLSAGGVTIMSGLKDRVTIIIDGPVCDLNVDGDVICQEVQGDIEAGGSVKCNNVGGYIEAGGSVSCFNVGGDMEVAGSAKCGDVGGYVEAGGSVDCKVIHGDVEAGGSIGVSSK